VKYAKERKASYTHLVMDHNRQWCEIFKEGNQYQKMLEEIIVELEEELNKIPPPVSKVDKLNKKKPKKAIKK
jgi:hypothetical protein